MKKLSSRLTLSVLSIAFLCIGACAEAPKNKDKNTDQEKMEKKKETPAVKEEAVDENISIMLPSPIQIAAIFNRAGLEYQDGLVNPAANVDKYNTKTSRYLNFGVYSADLAYAVLNNKQQAAIDQLNAVKSLSDAIGMTTVFGKGNLIKSFEKNIGNQDSVLHILTKIKRRTDAYLEENADKSKDAIFFSAAWIEGMYLGANSVTKKDSITPRLIEQMSILDNIIKAVEMQNDPTLDISYVVDGLKEVNHTFSDLPQVKKYKNGEIELEEVILSKEELNAITERITDLRNQIVES